VAAGLHNQAVDECAVRTPRMPFHGLICRLTAPTLMMFFVKKNPGLRGTSDTGLKDSSMRFVSAHDHDANLGLSIQFSSG